MGETQARPTRVVVGVDGSEDGAEALTVGVRLARALGAEVVAVFAYEGPTHFSHGSLYGLHLEGAQDGRERLRQVHRFRSEWCRPLVESGLPHQALVEEGMPGPAIAGLANRMKADYVVVGRRGLARLAEMVMGSTSEYLTHHCEAPVVVVSRKHGRRPAEQATVPSSARQG